MTTEPTKPKSKRRWFQFSLRTLIVFMLVTSVGLGFLGMKLNNERRRRQMIAEIEQMGGRVNIDFSTGDLHIWLPQAARDLSFRIKYPIKYLYFDNTKVSDLSPLAGMTNLQELGLDQTQVSDLTPLAELKTLKVLVLRNTPVSDVSPLSNLTNLELLDLQNTQVTDAGVARLQKALPNCKIEH
ncbi:MAG: leucine-rich repeat domain-containing protein [Planctomycetes bacterium]|nr:leucine-rich repeat domain-containing protein [Planctomycetota bacterium]